jgi:hypothetical protein
LPAAKGTFVLCKDLKDFNICPDNTRLRKRLLDSRVAQGIRGHTYRGRERHGEIDRDAALNEERDVLVDQEPEEVKRPKALGRPQGQVSDIQRRDEVPCAEKVACTARVALINDLRVTISRCMLSSADDYMASESRFFAALDRWPNEPASCSLACALPYPQVP